MMCLNVKVGHAADYVRSAGWQLCDECGHFGERREADRSSSSHICGGAI